MKILQIFGSSSSLRIVALTVAALALGSSQFAQGRRSAPIVNSLTDVVNAMQFSPDSRTLAIARGSRDDNRVELWNTESGKLRRTIRGFDGQIWSVSFSPDGETLVTGSGGIHQEKVAQKPLSHNGRPFTELKWWDPQTGDLKQRVELPDEELVSVAAVHSPNGRLLAAVENRLSMRMASFDDLGPLSRDPMTRAYPMLHSGMFDSDLRLLDAANGEVRLKLKDGFTNSQFPMFGGISRADLLSGFLPHQPSAAIAFSPDGQLVAAWNASEIRLWNSSTGSEVLKIKKFKGRMTAVAFSPDGRLIAGAIVKFSLKDRRPDYKSEIRIWETATGAPRQVVPLATQSVSSLIFASNGQQLLVAGLQSEDNHSFASMELADLQTGSLGKLIAKDEGTMSSICVSPDGATMAFQTDASTVKLLDTQSWRTKFTLGSDEASSNNTSLRRFLVTVNSTSAVAFLDDGKTIAGEIENGGIKLWDSRTGEVKKTLAQEAETGSIAAISANGSAIAEVAPDDSVRLWNVETGKHRIIPARNSKVSAIALSADGKVLVTAYASAIVWTDASDLKATRAIEGVSDISALAVSMNATLLAASGNGTIKIWKTDGSLKQNISANGQVTALQFGAEDKFLAVGRKDGTLSVWNIATGQSIFEARKHSSAVNAIAFSKDGMLMATGSDDRTAIIWELASRRARRTLKGHDLAITSLAFSPDGAMLAVGSGNASVVLWEVEKGRLDRVLK